MKKIPNTKGEMKMNNLMTYRKTFAMLVIAMLSLSALLTAVPVKAAGTVHCVPNSMIDPSCSDGHSTIQAAIYDAVAGDTVLVGAGTYAGSDVAQSVNIVSTQGAVIDCGVPGGTPSGFQIQYYTVSDVTIDGFKITNCDSGIVISGTRTYSNIVIRNTDIYANRNYGIFVGYNPTVNGLTIENVKLRGSGFEGMHNARGTITNLAVRNGELSNNKGFGFVNYGTLNGATFDNVNILNNDNTGMGLRGTANDVTITGCTFSGSAWEELDLGFWGGQFSTTGITITESSFIRTRSWAAIFIDGAGSFAAGAIRINYNDILPTYGWAILNNKAVPVDATNNWWGHATGPLHISTWTYNGMPYGPNPGLGGRVSNYVLYNPWALGKVMVTIDIKPGSSENPINLKSKGVIPVAILGSAGLNVYDISLESLRFAGSLGLGVNPVQHAYEDVNGDGITDLVLHFRTQEVPGLNKDTTQGYLTGQTNGGVYIWGTDSVKIVP